MHRPRIKELRTQSVDALTKGEYEEATRHLQDARLVAEMFNDNEERLNLDKDMRFIGFINTARVERENGDLKSAEELFSAALAKLPWDIDHPDLRQKIYAELDCCEALSFKDDGKKAYQNKDFPSAIDLYEKALLKALSAGEYDLSAQLLQNLSLIHSQRGDDKHALQYAKMSIKYSPTAFYKGYYRAAQVLKNMKRPKEALDILCEGLKKTSPPRVQMIAFVTEIMTLERELGVVPIYLTSLPVDEYSCHVKRAQEGHSPSWNLVENLIVSYEMRHGPERIGTLAKDVDLTGYFTQPANERNNKKLKTILKAGASPCKAHLYRGRPITAAITNKDWKAIPLLIEYGADARDFSLTEGDTPPHAALKVAFTQHDNFQLLKAFLDLHEKDRDKHEILDPSQQDKRHGDTLLHVAAKSRDVYIGMQAVKVLLDEDVDEDICNDEGKTAIMCLPTRSDPRASVFADEGNWKRRLAKSRKRIQHILDKLDQDDSDSSDFEEDEAEPEAAATLGNADLSSKSRHENESTRHWSQKSAGQTLDSACPPEEDKKERLIFSEANTKRTETLEEKRTENQFQCQEFQASDSVASSVGEDDSDDTLEPGYFKDLEWEIECTSDVWKMLYKKRLDKRLMKRIFKTIKMLASGEFNDQPHLIKRLDSVPKNIQLFEAKVTKAARLVWEIDITFSSRQSHPSTARLSENEQETKSTDCKAIYAEVIRIWDIVFDHDKIYKSVQNVVKSHKRGEECLLQKKLIGIEGKEGCLRRNGRRIPRTFTVGEDGSELFIPPASSKGTEYQIMKWYSFHNFFISSILDNQEVKIDFPFSVTEQEDAIINIQHNPPSPILLLGRSGTGKTTCCLYRLWSRFVKSLKIAVGDNPLPPRAVKYSITMGDKGVSTKNQSEDAIGVQGGKVVESSTDNKVSGQHDKGACSLQGSRRHINDRLHQIFITKNPILCTEVSRNFEYLSHPCPEAKHHVDVEDEPLPNRLQAAHRCAYPLFLTSKQFLLMLDASLPEPHFFERTADGSLKRDIVGWGEDDGPLTFIPDMEDDEDSAAEEEENQDAAATDQNKKWDPRREVTYELFAEELWPQMKKAQKKKVVCHASLVWTEINSFIKGSAEALRSKHGWLDLDDYESLGRKRAPNFLGSRELIYQLFQSYQKLIKKKRYFDEMDLIFNLYRRIRRVECPEWLIHEIYVDEAQDFTHGELDLLVQCCLDPNNMFLTGDTAQSIMRGIAFRFEDLRSLFYCAKEERGKATPVGAPQNIYNLIHNYRSHSGILDLATSILDLIDVFFPGSYDRGKLKDTGLFKGPEPVVIDCCSYSDLALLLCGSKRETSQIEFGAHQAILVVNEEARDKIPEELSFGLVLTIYESKGLEFDDILLFNFFKDSAAKDEWRVLLDLDTILSEQEKARKSSTTCQMEVTKTNTSAGKGKKRPHLKFDPQKHKILNSELKHLYTAVTRARGNVWFFDEDKTASTPMFEYFKAKKLVRTVKADVTGNEHGLTELFFKKSSKTEWKSRGDELLKKHMYKVAGECYIKAGREKLYQLCRAHQQVLEAKRTVDDNTLKRERYMCASLKYLKCNQYLSAAKCLYNAREYRMALQLYSNMKVKKPEPFPSIHVVTGEGDGGDEQDEQQTQADLKVIKEPSKIQKPWRCRKPRRHYYNRSFRQPRPHQY